VTEPAATAEAGPLAPRLPAPDGRGRRIVTIGLAVVILAAAAAAGWQWSQRTGTARVFYAADAEGPTTWNDQWQIGRPISFGISYVNDDVASSTSVDYAAIFSAKPHVLVNTSAATLTVSVCRIDPSGRAGAIGSVSNLAHWCTRLVPADGARMSLGRRSRPTGSYDRPFAAGQGRRAGARRHVRVRRRSQDGAPWPMGAGRRASQHALNVDNRPRVIPKRRQIGKTGHLLIHNGRRPASRRRR
jgi:hypothetical protein